MCMNRDSPLSSWTTLNFACNAHPPSTPKSGVEKFVGTSFIGVSPEFELALYTMAFMRTLHTGEEDNYVTLDVGGGEAFDLNVKCHTYNDNQVGSCYVEATAHYD